jgi:uncharacterized protein (DUF427 family)
MLAAYNGKILNIPVQWESLPPPRVEDFKGKITVVFNNEVIARANHAKRVVEASFASTFFLPLEAIRAARLVATEGLCWCNWRGKGQFFDVVIPGYRAKRGAWHFPKPGAGYEALKNYVAFDASRMDACFIDGHRVKEQHGVHGGWVLDTR